MVKNFVIILILSFYCFNYISGKQTVKALIKSDSFIYQAFEVQIISSNYFLTNKCYRIKDSIISHKPKSEGFGSKFVSLVNLKGNLYFLDNATYQMPRDLENRQPAGYLYARSFNISNRSFMEGFPGITDRYEWFGLVYTGMFEITKPGEYKWRLVSDDGSILWIDNQKVIDNDGHHAMLSKREAIFLDSTKHKIKLWYFQGPRYNIGLQLFVTPPDEPEKIFVLDEYSQVLIKALKQVKGVATKEGIRIQIPNRILFDINRFEIKPSSDSTISLIKQIITYYPDCKVKIEGHTDNSGNEAYNLILSEKRPNRC